MSTEEVADSTLQESEESKLLERIAKWRTHRVELFERGEGPVSVASGVTVLFHVIPAGSLTRRVLAQSWSVSEQEKARTYVSHTATNRYYNAEGFLTVAGYGNQGCAGYTQLFRSGVVEYANSNCSGPMNGIPQPMIFGQSIEQEIVRCYEDASQHLHLMDDNEAVYLGLSLIGIAGKDFYVTPTRLAMSGNLPKPKQNTFISPEVLGYFTTEEESPYSHILLPLVNTMWQVAGLGETPFRHAREWAPFRDYR